MSLKRGMLVVHTRTAAWAQELSFHEADLLASIQKRIPLVKRLRIRVGPMPPPPNSNTPYVAYIRLVPESLVGAFGIGLAAAMVACLGPSFRVSRSDVADALRRNI